MGFNSVRVVGLDVVSSTSGEVTKSARLANGHATTIVIFSSDENCEKYFKAVQLFFDAVNAEGLKIVFLNSIFHQKSGTEKYLKRLTENFSCDTAVMAYDLFNEPLYFDSLDRTKKEVFEITRGWKKIIEDNAPHQLCTIGLEGIREVFKWDPNILNVDFLSMHPYEYEPEQVQNEIYWYSKYIHKPWMIGETSLPADDDSVPYSLQKQFAAKTLKRAYDCGAWGYTWWQYKDVDWKVFFPSFMGVVNRKGRTKTKYKNFFIKGTPKPVADEFKNFTPGDRKKNCPCLSNYYNYSPNSNFRIRGHLADENNKPIEGGVIIAWNQWWSHSFHTVTKADGSFELLGNFQFYHWMASATKYSMTRGDVFIQSARKGTDSIPTVDIGRLRVSKLAFAD